MFLYRRQKDKKKQKNKNQKNTWTLTTRDYNLVGENDGNDTRNGMMGHVPGIEVYKSKWHCGLAGRT